MTKHSLYILWNVSEEGTKTFWQASSSKEDLVSYAKICGYKPHVAESEYYHFIKVRNNERHFYVETVEDYRYEN